MACKRKPGRRNRKRKGKQRKAVLKDRIINCSFSLQEFEDFFVKYRLGNFEDEIYQNLTLVNETIDNDNEFSYYGFEAHNKHDARLPIITEVFSESVCLVKQSEDGGERLHSEDPTTNKDLNLEGRLPTDKSPPSKTDLPKSCSDAAKVPIVVLESLAVNETYFVCDTCYKLFDTRSSLDVHELEKNSCKSGIDMDCSHKFDDQNNPYQLKNLSIDLPTMKSEIDFHLPDDGADDTESISSIKCENPDYDSDCEVVGSYQFVISITGSSVMRDRPPLNSQPSTEMAAPCFETAAKGPIAALVLEKAVFAKRNFVCGVCFGVFLSLSSLKVHKLFHTPPLYLRK